LRNLKVVFKSEQEKYKNIKYNIMKKLLQRFSDIWKLDFLAKFFAGEKEDHKTTVLFWLASNMLVAIMLSVSLFVFLYSSSDTLVTVIDENIPENARITITDGQLTTKNIDEPFFREINAHNDDNNYDGSYAVIIDTRSDTYDITSLDAYDGGIIVVGDRVYFKDGVEFNHIIFSEVPNFSVQKNDVIHFADTYFLFPFSIIVVLFAALFMFGWLAGFRLISAFWWALLLFVLTKIFDVHCRYVTAYKAVLNFYFIPTIVVFIVGLVSVHVQLLTTLIFIAVFIANVIWIKKHPQTGVVKNVFSSVTEVDINTIQQAEKNSDKSNDV